MKRSIFLLLFFIVFFGCKSDNDLKKYEITKYVEVDENFQYSKDMLRFDKKKYKPTITFRYDNDTLSSVVVYKSEGGISYNILELKKDSLLMEMYEISEVKKAKISKNIFYDDKKEYPITEQRKDSVFCLLKGNLLFVKLLD
ncbi:hypothetical protein [Flavobacterium chungangensis]|uniref:Lipoprotein n=1 Tax=Flavobacterium chungangensis TaxID=2708132 RepID=A0ABV8ZC17_9FLAO